MTARDASVSWLTDHLKQPVRDNGEHGATVEVKASEQPRVER